MCGYLSKLMYFFIPSFFFTFMLIVFWEQKRKKRAKDCYRSYMSALLCKRTNNKQPTYCYYIVTTPSHLSVLSMLAFSQLIRLVPPASIKHQSFLANIFFHQPTLSRVPFVFPLCKSYSSFIREDSMVAFLEEVSLWPNTLASFHP